MSPRRQLVIELCSVSDSFATRRRGQRRLCCVCSPRRRRGGGLRPAAGAGAPGPSNRRPPQRRSRGGRLSGRAPRGRPGPPRPAGGRPRVAVSSLSGEARERRVRNSVTTRPPETFSPVMWLARRTSRSSHPGRSPAPRARERGAPLVAEPWPRLVSRTRVLRSWPVGCCHDAIPHVICAMPQASADMTVTGPACGSRSLCKPRGRVSGKSQPERQGAEPLRRTGPRGRGDSGTAAAGAPADQARVPPTAIDGTEDWTSLSPPPGRHGRSAEEQATDGWLLLRAEAVCTVAGAA